MKARRLIVCTDASFQDGLAALAVTGAVGRHSKVISCGDALVAEFEAVLLALEVASEEHLSGVAVEFRTDCQAVARAKNGHPFPTHQGLAAAAVALRAEFAAESHWKLCLVDRTKVQEAHALARRTRRTFRPIGRAA